jgi:hypothetical protein
LHLFWIRGLRLANACIRMNISFHLCNRESVPYTPFQIVYSGFVTTQISPTTKVLEKKNIY